jgi:outer membrane protein assembly factor BamA
MALSFEVTVQGNTRTLTKVIITEIKDLTDQKLTKDTVSEIKRRIWNLRLFSSVRIDQPDNTKILIQVKERWTTIPIMKFSSGGGSSYFALGVYDINTAGLNTELGIQYEELNKRAAGVLWLRKPQFLYNRNFLVGIDLWNINRIRFMFDQDGNESGAYTLQRKKSNLFFEYKFHSDLYKLGLNLEYNDDQISDFGLDQEQIELNTKNGFRPEYKSITRWYTFYFEVGRLNYKNYLVDGKKLILTSSLAATSSFEDKILSKHELKFNYYKLIKNTQNLAWQFKFSANNLNQLQFQNYIGGFSEVRGYQDGQFSTPAFWQNNLEYRTNLYENKFGIVQGAVFSDQANETTLLNNTTDKNMPMMLSTGFGIRLISPKIYRFVGRIDYAQTHTRVLEKGISIGIQQFF